MPEAVILEFSGVGKAEYDAVNAELGIDMATGEGTWPPGLISHAAGLAEDDSFIVMEVWTSRDDQAAFMSSRLGAALAAGGIDTVPKVRWVPLVAFRLPGA